MILVEAVGLGLLLALYLRIPRAALQPNMPPRDPQPAAPDSNALKSAIGAAHAKADVVIVSYHWGMECKHLPNTYQTRYARICIDAGADLVIGHHSHALQPIERYKVKYIFYSLGNCLFDREYQMTSESMLLSCTLSNHSVTDVKLLPLIIKNCRPESAVGQDFVRIESKIRKYCIVNDILIVEKGSNDINQIGTHFQVK